MMVKCKELEKEIATTKAEVEILATAKEKRYQGWEIDCWWLSMIKCFV